MWCIHQRPGLLYLVLSTLMSLWYLHLCCHHVMKPSLERRAALNQSARHTWGSSGDLWTVTQSQAASPGASSLSLLILIVYLLLHTKWKIPNMEIEYLVSRLTVFYKPGHRGGMLLKCKVICNELGARPPKWKVKNGKDSCWGIFPKSLCIAPIRTSLRNLGGECNQVHRNPHKPVSLTSSKAGSPIFSCLQCAGFLSGANLRLT